MFWLGKNKPIHTQMIKQDNSEKMENIVHFSTLVHSVYFLAKEEMTHTTKYNPLINNVVLKNNESLNEWVKKQSERSLYVSKATAIELLYCMGSVCTW